MKVALRHLGKETMGHVGLKLWVKTTKQGKRHEAHFNLPRQHTEVRKKFSQRKRSRLNLLGSGP